MRILLGPEQVHPSRPSACHERAILRRIRSRRRQRRPGGGRGGRALRARAPCWRSGMDRSAAWPRRRWSIRFAACISCRTTKTSRPPWPTPGFAPEFARRLDDRRTAHTARVRLGRVDVLLHRPAAFARLADVIAHETPGLTVQLHTETRRRRRLTPSGVVVPRPDAGRSARAPGWTPPATPCSPPSGASATEMEPSAVLQRPAFILRTRQRGPRPRLTDDGRLRLARRIVGAVRDGSLPARPCSARTFAPARSRAKRSSPSISSGGDQFDPLDPACLTALEIRGPGLCRTPVLAFLRADCEGFGARRT